MLLFADLHSQLIYVIFQADFGFLVRMYAIVTQGRNGVQEQWVTLYKLTYSREADGAFWHEYMEDGVIRVQLKPFLQHNLKMFITYLLDKGGLCFW